MIYCARSLLILTLLSLASILLGETKIVDATVAETTERGFVLMVGTEALPVQDESGTRFWNAKKPAERAAFGKGSTVKVRIRTDITPPVLREMADRTTWDWLDRIRKNAVSGTIRKVDSQTITLEFEDGSQFTYRATERSDVKIGGKSIPATDLREGQKVWVKGRTLPSLDTWLVSLSDQPYPVATKKGAKSAKRVATKPKKLPQSGSIKGVTDLRLPAYRMLDVLWEGTRIHVIYNTATQWTLGGRKAAPEDASPGRSVHITYRRDAFGRIIATKIELFESAV